MAFTKVTGPGIHTLSNILSHNIDSSGIITATKFVGTFEGSTTGDLVTNDWITHEGDTNTKFGFPTTDTFTVETAGDERLRITSSGLVGIGTDIPSGKLNLVGSDSQIFNIIQDTGDLTIRLNDRGSSSSYIKIPDGSGALTFETGGSERLRIKSTGAVGIGTDSPTDTLHVGKLNANHGIKLERYGATNPGSSTIQVHSHGALSVTSANNITHTSGGSQQHVWMQGTNEAMRIDENRRLGIGTDDPTEKLDVRGNLVVAESLAVNRPRIVLSAPNDGTNYRHLFGANLQVNSSGTFTTPTANISGGGWEYLPANSINAHGVIRYLSAPDTNATTSTPLERLRINASGRVGINTTNPDMKLEVYNGGIKIDRRDAADTSNPHLSMRTGANGSSRLMIYAEDHTDDNSNWIYKTNANEEHIFHIGSTERLRINASGQLLMTNTVTTEFLAVNSTNNNTRGTISMQGKNSSGAVVTLKMGGFGDTQRGEIFTHSNHALGFAAGNAATQMVLSTAGYLGINCNSPTRPLHIIGNDGSSGATSGNSDTTLVLENAGTNGSMIEFLNANNGAGHIMFTDVGGANRGRISYHHQDDYFRIDTGGNQRASILSDGRITTNVVNNRGGIALVGAFMARPSATYSKNAGTEKVSLGTEEFDANGWFNTGNSRYTPLCKGWYQFNFFYQIRTNINNQQVELYLYPYKNGAAANGGPVHGWDDNYGNYAFITFSTMIYCNGTTDYIEMYGNSSRSTEVSVNSRMSGFLVHPVA